MDRRLVVFELNEVPYQVIDRFVTDHPNSTFAEVLPRASCRTSYLPDTGQLHPKISWQTFHRGVPDHVHGYKEYNQIEAPGRDTNPTFLEIARDAGLSVGCGASIGSWPIPEQKQNVSFWMADPFAPSPESIPSTLDAFQRFNTAAVARSSRNVRGGGLDKKVATDFLCKLPALGIRPATCLSVVRQLIDERRDRTRAVRRRNIQALMSFDVCLHQWKRTTPKLATLFGNHVAAAMHRYWAAAFPDDYDVNNMPQDWRDTYADEIDAAMLVADDMLKRLLKAAADVPGTTVLLVGSMGQEGIAHEVTRNQLVVDDMARFMSLLGFESDSYERRPGMEPEYPLAFNDAAGLDAFDAACKRMDINGSTPYCKRVNDIQCALLVDQYNIDFDHVTLDGQQIPLGETGLKIESIDDFAGSTAQHVPEGICIALNPAEDLSAHSSHEGTDDLCAVTSSVLAAVGAPVPDYMPAPVDALVSALRGEPGTTTTGRDGGTPATAKSAEENHQRETEAA